MSATAKIQENNRHCHNCWCYGHSEANCPDEKRSLYQRELLRRDLGLEMPVGAYTEAIKLRQCNNCWRVGHFTQDCSDPKRTVFEKEKLRRERGGPMSSHWAKILQDYDIEWKINQQGPDVKKLIDLDDASAVGKQVAGKQNIPPHMKGKNHVGSLLDIEIPSSSKGILLDSNGIYQSKLLDAQEAMVRTLSEHLKMQAEQFERQAALVDRQSKQIDRLLDHQSTHLGPLIGIVNRLILDGGSLEKEYRGLLNLGVNGK